MTCTSSECSSFVVLHSQENYSPNHSEIDSSNLGIKIPIFQDEYKSTLRKNSNFYKNFFSLPYVIEQLEEHLPITKGYFDT